MSDDIKEGYTRVSTILRQLGCYRGIRQDTLTYAQERGTNVHIAIAEEVPIALTGEEQPYYDSYRRWIEQTGAVLLEREIRYYDDKLMITGQIDAIARLPEVSKYVLIDWKCASSAMNSSWQLQATYYMHLARERMLSGVDLDRMLFIQLDKDGESPIVHEYEWSNKLWAICKAFLATYRYRQEYKLLDDKQDTGLEIVQDPILGCLTIAKDT